MIIATGLAYSIMSIIYFQEAATFDPKAFHFSAEDLPTVARSLTITDVSIIFSWTAEFAVKIALLLFFKRLVDRIPRLTLYVKLVIAFNLLVWIYFVCEPFILCPHFDVAMISKVFSCQFYLLMAILSISQRNAFQPMLNVPLL